MAVVDLFVNMVQFILVYAFGFDAEGHAHFEKFRGRVNEQFKNYVKNRNRDAAFDPEILISEEVVVWRQNDGL